MRYTTGGGGHGRDAEGKNRGAEEGDKGTRGAEGRGTAGRRQGGREGGRDRGMEGDEKGGKEAAEAGRGDQGGEG